MTMDYNLNRKNHYFELAIRKEDSGRIKDKSAIIKHKRFSVSREEGPPEPDFVLRKSRGKKSSLLKLDPSLLSI